MDLFTFLPFNLEGTTVFLWLKFAEYRRLLVKPDYAVPLLDIEMDIATAHLIYAIVATVLTVSGGLYYFKAELTSESSLALSLSRACSCLCCSF